MSARRVAFSRETLLAAFTVFFAVPVGARAQDTAPPTPPPSAAPAVVVPPSNPVVASPAYRDPASGAEIYTTVDDAMFPETWRDPAIGATAAPLAPGRPEIARSLAV